MKQLVVLCHPSSESLSQIISTELTRLYEKYKIEVEVRDLYKIGFNPVLSNKDLEAEASGKVLEDVSKEQEYIANAEIIMFIYPIWRTGMPAMMKGYMERVFSKGFAYSFTEKGIKQLLEGKKVVLVNTYNSTDSLYGQKGLNEAAISCEKYVFEAFGMEVILHYFLQNIHENMDSNALKDQMDNLRKEIKRTFIIGNNIRLNIPTAFF